MVNLKGQGATEYLVLFAVVLIIAMVVIALLGFFPSVGTGGKQSASDSYWQSARPIEVTSHSATALGVLTLNMQNAETSAVKVTGICFGTGAGAANMVYCTGAAYTMGVGESTSYTNATAAIPATNRCTSASSYEYYLSFNYTENTNTYAFYGVKPIIGKCI